jgi:hypothetical protein
LKSEREGRRDKRPHFTCYPHSTPLSLIVDLL